MSAGAGKGAAAIDDPVVRCCKKFSDARSAEDLKAAAAALKQLPPHQVCAGAQAWAPVLGV
jgi:hypothetical protein